MSNLSLDFSDNAFQPLAARMRPENLAQYIGQQHLLAPGKPLPRAIEAGHLHSMILWGPPGTKQDHSGGSDCPLRQRRCRTDLSGNLRGERDSRGY